MDTRTLRAVPHAGAVSFAQVERLALSKIMLEETIEETQDPISRKVLRLNLQGCRPREISRREKLPIKEVLRRLERGWRHLELESRTWQFAC